ncbi:MAG: GntG family PLP-dependent aldolase [Paracoccaceae bacterium]
MIDLRSDTVTIPDQAMRAAMAQADMGDDCFGDDPTTRALEEYCADYFDKDAALFTTGGTQSNQIAMKSLTSPGDEVVINGAYHINFFEAAATSTFSGVNFNLIHSEDGTSSVEQIEEVFETKARWNDNYAMPRVVVLENTVGSKGGTVLALSEMQRIKAYANKKGAKLYLDGARVLHATASTGIPVKEYAAASDCMAMCFSKSLGAPVGSILVGTTEFIDAARRHRKWFGGDLHQAGIVAAGAHYALKHNAHRLVEDHENMALIYHALRQVSGVRTIYRGTNMVFADVSGLDVNATKAVEEIKRNGVNCLAWDQTHVRFVTHLNIDQLQAKRAAGKICQSLENLKQIKPISHDVSKGVAHVHVV